MAITHISGTVTRTFYSGKGAEVAETFTAGGKEITKKWACWFDEPHGLTEGEAVNVSGLHSDVVDDWQDKEGETRHSVKRSLNKSRIKREGTSAAPSAPTAPEPEPWATPDTETPF